jgi:serine/threonine protein kinase
LIQFFLKKSCSIIEHAGRSGAALLCELISAFDYLHNSQFVAHRDLTAENVLLDFGLSNYFTKAGPGPVTACRSPETIRSRTR